MAAIDLNAHLVESYGFGEHADDAIFDLATSVTVPCGCHVGDPTAIRRACQVAADHNVSIGAQVAYPDVGGAGRRAIDLDPRALRDAVLYQLGALDGFAQVAGTGVKYIKPFGPLAEACLTRPAHAEAVVEAAHEYDPAIAVLGVPGSPVLAVADSLGMELVPEAFADRAYTPGGRLVPRNEMDAVVTDCADAARRAVAIATEHRLTAVDGSTIEVRIRSICLPTGTPGAVELARAIREGLEAASVGIHGFAL